MGKHKDDIIIIGIIALVVALIVVNIKMTDDFMTKCQNAGYSKNYCISQK